VSGRAGQIALVLAAGFVAGLAGGLFGVGGGIVLVPILTGVFHLTQHQAHGTSLAAIGATAIASLFVYAAHGNVAWGTALGVALASVFTARWGARWAAQVSHRNLRRAFAALLAAVAIRLLWRAPAGHGVHFAGPALAVGFDLLLGAAAGVLSGFMGVGGGILAVPAFTLVLGMTQAMGQGTSLAVILVTAPAGAVEHHRHGNLVLRVVPGLAVGAALGGPLASTLAHHLPQAVLARAFAVFLLASAAQLWLRSGKARPSRDGGAGERSSGSPVPERNP
jgi:uncharacterized membrane protein YfcA